MYLVKEKKKRPIFAVLGPSTTSFSIIPIAVLMPQRSTLSCWTRFSIEHLIRGDMRKKLIK